MKQGGFRKLPHQTDGGNFSKSKEVMPCRALARDIARDDHWIDVFTDGSCMFPSEPAYRFASWAVCVAGLDISWEHSDVIGAGPIAWHSSISISSRDVRNFAGSQMGCEI